MNTPDAPRLLTDAEIGRLDTLLESIDPDDSMTVEELDGFFAALACCPERVQMDEYLPVVLGLAGGRATPQTAEVAELQRLLEVHWLAVVGQLHEASGFAPVLSYDEEGVAQGNAWAIGFLRGMAMRPDAWSALEDDDEAADILDPMMRLAEEVEAEADEAADGDPAGAAGGPDPAGPDLAGSAPAGPDLAGPIPAEERGALIEAMFDSVMDINEFFREQRRRNLSPPTLRRDAAKVGRNDPCPCGSGKKYKQCCGAGQGG